MEQDTRPASYVFGGLGFRYPVACTRADLDVVARAGSRLWEMLGLRRATCCCHALPVERTAEHEALQFAALAAATPALFPGP